MIHDEIRDIPPEKTVTYACIVVDYWPQKSNPNRARLTVGGNLLNVPGYLSTTTSHLTTSKILWNSVLSTKYARFAWIDIKNMYLQTPMTDYKYMWIPCHLVPQEFIDEYALESKIHKGFFYCEIRKGIYGLPQSGKLANTLLKQRLATCGYIECMNTPGLWRNIFRPVQFTLVVDYFGVKFVGVKQLRHIVESLKKFYEIVLDPTGSK